MGCAPLFGEHLLITLKGLLAVNAIAGKKGVFHVGRLSTSIGDFAIRDKELDQFNPGSYEGSFLIERIYLASTRWKNGYFSDVQATIAKDGYLINDVDETPPLTESMTQPDPLETEIKKTDIATAGVAAKAKEATAAPVDLSAADVQLFGEDLYAAFTKGEEVRLDTTVDRDVFRRQRDRLKNVGYRFDSMGQFWFLPG